MTWVTNIARKWQVEKVAQVSLSIQNTILQSSLEVYIRNEMKERKPRSSRADGEDRKKEVKVVKGRPNNFS